MRYVAAAFFLFLLAAPASNAVAQPFPRGGEGGPFQPLDNIIMNIRQSFPGQVSDVQGPAGGRYRVKWLTPDGRVLWVIADARTGRILGVEGGGGQRNFGPPNFIGPGEPPRGFGGFDEGYGPDAGAPERDGPYGARPRPRWDQDGDGFRDRRGRPFGR